MIRWMLFACALALAAPLARNAWLHETSGPSEPAHWPAQFQGRILSELPLTARERAFASDFPGSTARFTDGEHDIVMRWVTHATRRLHPAADCYRGLGYSISATRIVADRDNVQWRCFIAHRDGEVREVCEQIQDREGRRWTDVSAWYWAAVLKRTEGPWLVTTVAE